MDGNHENNNPDNLILLECGDHNRIHDIPLTWSRITAIEIRKRKSKERLDKDIKRGHFHQRKIKGKNFWYFVDNKEKKQKYIGVPNPELDEVIRAYSQSPKSTEDWLQLLDGLRVLSASCTVNASE